MHGIVIASRCHYCSKQLSPEDMHTFMSGQNWCRSCFTWHLHAVEVLHGAFPKGCQECGLLLDDLKKLSPAHEISVRMFVVPKDGIYQLLCRTCKDTYCMKRADLYKGTQFAAEQKIA
jgi:hypothetical protein